MSLSTLSLTVNSLHVDFKCLGSIKVLMSSQIYADRSKLCVPNLKASYFQEIPRLCESCQFFCAVEARKKSYNSIKEYLNGWTNSHSTEETPHF